MTKKRKDLVLVHFEAQVVHCHLPAECLSKAVHNHCWWPEDRLVHYFCWNCFRILITSFNHHIHLHGIAVDCWNGFSSDHNLWKPIRRLIEARLKSDWNFRMTKSNQNKEVERLCNANSGRPNLGEVPSQQAVDKDVRKLRKKFNQGIICIIIRKR